MTKNERTGKTVFFTPKGRRVTLEMREGLPSVSSVMQGMADAGLPEGQALLSDYRGNVSPDDAPFLQRRGDMHTARLSLLLRPALHAKNAMLLSALASVTFTHTLQRLGKEAIHIEWVDEIWTARGKIAVMDSTCSLRSDGYLHHFILNISFLLPKPLFEEGLSDMVREVFDGMEHSLPGRISHAFLKEFFTLYESIAFDRSFVEEYKRLSALKGRHALLMQNGKRRRVTVLGIDDTARLLVETRKKEVLPVSSRSDITFF